MNLDNNQIESVVNTVFAELMKDVEGEIKEAAEDTSIMNKIKHLKEIHDNISFHEFKIAGLKLKLKGLNIKSKDNNLKTMTRELICNEIKVDKYTVLDFSNRNKIRDKVIINALKFSDMNSNEFTARLIKVTTDEVRDSDIKYKGNISNDNLYKNVTNNVKDKCSTCDNNL